jgi:hypothetical protein
MTMYLCYSCYLLSMVDFRAICCLSALFDNEN